MSFDQKKYISDFNKSNYKMYQFRIKKTNHDLINYLDGLKSRNDYIVSLLESKVNRETYTIKEIKKIIKPILNKHEINEIYLFGSYARGEATKTSDVDIYCETGNVKTLIDQGFLEDELEEALNKKVDIVFTTSYMDDYFREQIMEDMIKLC